MVILSLNLLKMSILRSNRDMCVCVCVCVLHQHGILAKHISANNDISILKMSILNIVLLHMSTLNIGLL